MKGMLAMVLLMLGVAQWQGVGRRSVRSGSSCLNTLTISGLASCGFAWYISGMRRTTLRTSRQHAG